MHTCDVCGMARTYTNGFGEILPTIGVCVGCRGAGTEKAMPVPVGGREMTYLSSRECRVCKGSGYGKE